jgi:two-component system chemotaxis sensor kinase CheA
MQYNPLETYLQEAEELLAEIEQSALSISAGERTEETINQLFRAFHTIKGSGAICGLDAVAGFTHHVESLLDRVREGAIPVSPALAELVLIARDHIRILLAAEQGGPPAPAGSSERLIAAVAEFANPGLNIPEKGSVAPTEPAAEHPESAEQTWRIRFCPNPSLLVNGGNPSALLRELRELGPCEITAHAEDVPALDSIQPDLCYLWWTITLQSAADQNVIRDVFIFVEDDSQLEIEVTPEVLPPVPLLSTAAAPSPDRPAVTPPADHSGAGDAPGAGAPLAPSRALARESTVRVPSNRLDRLVNLVGELVMNQSRLAQAASKSGSPEFTNPVQELERLVAELRDNVLGIRMLPIGTLFGRFRRLVHDLSAELGKEADLVTEGADTELDKSILDQLGEPLVHCLRNCLDHAVEPPEERLAKGKPRRATIRLAAIHTGSDVVVSIQDDGRGIDRAAVRARAVEKQLIAPAASLTDKDIFNLILMPGFSTARQVTSVSGRGVGMDAVKRQIDALRGSLSLASEEGKGVRVSITLPLTLAIIEGLLVEIGSDQFIVPMAAVTENVELLRSQRARNNGRNVIAVRGELVPYIDLRTAFRIGSTAPSIEKVVIVQHEEHRVGLVVDRVLGTHQTVIQSLGKFLRTIEVVSGATIMGDGRVALIMDVAAVVRFAERQCREDPADFGAGCRATGIAGQPWNHLSPAGRITGGQTAAIT